MPAATTSQNFAFLTTYEPQLDRLGALAERYFPDDPVTCLIKLRQFGELLARQTAARNGLAEAPEESQAELLRRLRFDAAVPPQVLDLFHQIRTAGNRAAHDNEGDHREALAGLKLCRQLAIWFHRTYVLDPSFKPGPFQPPKAPEHPDPATLEELAAFRAEREQLLGAAARAQEEAEAAARARESAEERARREAEDRAIWEQLAAEAEAQMQAALDQLAAVQAAAAQASPQQRAEQQHKAEAAADEIELDEAATRALIDLQLRNRGWEADTENLRYSKGTRPTKGRNLAIAEWPTASGPADYGLFVGLQCIGTVEAKRGNKSACGALGQSERYAKGMALAEGEAPDTYQAAGGPWGEHRVPFAFSSNGRPFLEQIRTESGIWFRDTRKATNLARPLTDWPTPDGLQGQLGIDIDAASACLKSQPMQFGFPLRPYQQQAIEAVEEKLAAGRRTLLVAMATGTGKTKLSIAMLYRLLTAKRFRRICFVVDRGALGEQAEGEFTTTNVISARTFSDIFNLKGLHTKIPDAETKIHICTIQGLVQRVLYAAEPADVPPIDQYDLLVVDECHRGYLLDRELSDAELSFRSQADYVSKYRRVLEHFDAVKIGLTATPALHTAQIFGEPVFTYSYREAVIDGYLIDHEPPIRILTALAAAGIHYARGDDIALLNVRTGAVQSAQTPDEIDFDVEAFNKKVITPAFNRVVTEELAKHIDPAGPGKTLVFAANDRHADLVVDLLKQAFQARYGAIDDAAVRKITGSVDQPRPLILRYRNDAMPKVAVTVDLLTTGIDVPRIVNLVFIRRVNSRILYEQMLGRGTRRCDEIGKETFRIFDAVDLYRNLQHLTEMRPVVVDPSIGLTQLFEEFTRVTEDAYRAAIRDQIVVKLRRRLGKLGTAAREQFEAHAGETPEATLQRLRSGPLDEAAAWAKARPALGAILDSDLGTGSTPYLIPISAHADRIAEVRVGYGTADKPEDFLDGFTRWIRHNINQVAALTVVVQRPRDLTRAQLKELRLHLDRLGYSDANLRRAWQDANPRGNPQGNNPEIAASIVGFIRQAALGDALIPFEQRVQGAMQRILAARAWTDPQRRWLERIAKQLLQEIVVDRPALDQPPFDAAGGFKRLNQVFDGRLEAVLGDINEELWRDAS